MHGEANYPLRKERSDLDLPLKFNTGDEEYLSLLQAVLPKLIDDFQLDFLFYISGVDVLSTDKWGRLNLSLNGCKNRDEFVLRTSQKHFIPLMISMGGGYSPNIDDIVEAHCNTFRSAFDIF
ncbi:MAG: hypothetical protein K9J16_11885 [Melioribacteraceae bacterium]|nr:hypothetical protein [Melioribacteraceae bacterium]MCF8354115.1 hypothetical protein [Melioribacteraceae bacterium]MCF8393342.1 hypothetical protein [Melioribacteraceae bacterium]MCF8418907.1 hypothetical protein [Melioribacteraceae bacterium]